VATIPITGLDVKGKRLLVRADLNVPMADDKVADATRIERFAAGMRPLLASGARLVILTHRGRPKGKVVAALSVDKLRPALAKALGVRVQFSPASTGASVEALSNALTDGEVILCENVRFNPGEGANDATLAAEYARLGDLYVNDAFSCAHRAHASTAAVAGLMPSYAGPLLLEELNALAAALEDPKRPSVAIVGGAKVSSKIAVLRHLVTQLDAIIIGGGMANTFLYADGAPMGTSLCEIDQVETVAEIKRLVAGFCCPAMWCARWRSKRARPIMWSMRTNARTTKLSLMRVRRRLRHFSANWRRRARSCGTVRWARLRSNRSTPRPRRWRAPQRR
jgi:phosphoglycerate kinase